MFYKQYTTQKRENYTPHENIPSNRKTLQEQREILAKAKYQREQQKHQQEQKLNQNRIQYYQMQKLASRTRHEFQNKAQMMHDKNKRLFLSQNQYKRRQEQIKYQMQQAYKMSKRDEVE